MSSAPLTSADVVGVFDSGMLQVFPLARPIKATVSETAKAMEHPVESGATITDHRIINPIEIELTMMLVGMEYRDTYNRIKSLFQKSDLLTVQTRTGAYLNMMIESIPHDETPDIYDAAPMTLKLKEVLLVTAQFQAFGPKSVAKKSSASTVKRGEQSTKTAPKPQQTTAQKIWHGWLGQ